VGGDNGVVQVFPLEFLVLPQPNGNFFDFLQFLLLVGQGFFHHNMAGGLGLVSYVFIPLCKKIVVLPSIWAIE
jgi:hypothetical protein